MSANKDTSSRVVIDGTTAEASSSSSINKGTGPLDVLKNTPTESERRAALAELGVNGEPAGYVPYSIELLRSVPPDVASRLTGQSDPATYLGTEGTNAGEAATSEDRPTQTTSNVLRTPSEAMEASLTPAAKTLMLQHTALLERLAHLGNLRLIHAQVDLARIQLAARQANVPEAEVVAGVGIQYLMSPYVPGPAETRLAKAHTKVVTAPAPTPRLSSTAPSRAPRRALKAKAPTTMKASVSAKAAKKAPARKTKKKQANVKEDESTASESDTGRSSEDSDSERETEVERPAKRRRTRASAAQGKDKE